MIRTVDVQVAGSNAFVDLVEFPAEPSRQLLILGIGLAQLLCERPCGEELLIQFAKLLAD